MYNIIEKNADLKNFCKKLKEETDIIALDTEFIRKYTYFPTLCLIQVGYINKNNEKIIALIDPIAKNLNLTPFLTILRSTKIKKIIHSASQDLDAFYFINKTKINNVEDTQLMCEFCNEENLSYTSALNKFLNMNIIKNKKVQISNWKKRPLTNKQIKYAGNDVQYLIELYNTLLNKLEENNNIELYKNELKNILTRRKEEYICENIWKKMKFSIHKEKLLDIILIKKLAKWREEKAIEENTIRSLILDDELLIEIAERKPRTLKEFKNYFLTEKQILNMPRIFRNEIIDIITLYNKNYSSVKDNELFYGKEKNFPYKEILNLLHNLIEEIAKQHNISFSLTLTQYEMIALIMKYERKRSILYGWKYKLFNNKITELFKNNKNLLP